MKSKIRYEAISRVVSESKEVIGFMVKPLGKKSKELYMSLDVVSFGLSNNTFEIEDVKLGGNGKPRGCNGFLLSKLPILNLNDEEDTKIKLLEVLKYIYNSMCEDIEIKVNFVYNRVGVLSTYSVSFVSSNYKDLPLDIANTELNKTLHFYLKHLPKEYKGYCDKIEGFIKEQGLNIVITKSLVSEV